MDASGPISFRAAAAYGVSPNRATAPTRPSAPVAAGESIRPPVVDIVETASTKVDGLRRLVAGTVRSDINRGIGFDQDGPLGTAPRPAPPRTDGTLHLYNRQADRMEAATGVALGRSLDVQG